MCRTRRVFEISGKSVKERDGKLSFSVYGADGRDGLPRPVKLLAIDHPAAYDVFPNERFASNPPFPEFRVVASRNARHRGRLGRQGNDVLKLLSARTEICYEFRGVYRSRDLRSCIGWN